MAIRLSNNRLRLRNGRIALATASSGTTPPDPGGGGNVTLTLVEIDKDRRLFARDALNGYDMTVSGTSSATSPVQARVVDADTGAVVVDWVNIGTPSGGNFSGVLRCPARVSPCRVQVRDSVDTASTKAAVNRFFVGEYWFWEGQSNAVNNPKTPYQYPLADKGSMEYISDVFKRIGSVNDAYPPNTRSAVQVSGGYPTSTSEDASRRGDGYVYLANVMSARLGCAICLVDISLGGQSITYWDTQNGGWTRTVAALTAIGGKASGMFFHQGEEDARTGMAQATYLAKETDFHSRLKTLFGPEFKFLVIPTGAVDATSDYATNISGIRAAQINFVNSTPGAYLAASNHDNTTTDSVHSRGISFAHLGPAAASTAAALAGQGPSGAGPRVVSATRSGAVITLNVQHAGGTALLDGAGGTGTALTGFRVTDGGAAASIASTAITSPTTITLTLSAAPSGAVTVDYAMIAAPHAPDLINPRVTPNYASAVYDNVALVNNTRGCILQPFPAITVTGS